MTNRLRNLLRKIRVFALLTFVLATDVNAQSSAFNFTPPSPNVFSVGPNCWRAVSTTPPPVVTSAIGANIITSVFASTNTYAYNDPWGAPTTLLVKWYVEDDLGNAYEFGYGVTFIDDSPPEFDLTGIPDTLTFQSVIQVPPPPTIPVSDNCIPLQFITISYSQTTPPDTCAAGIFKRTWTATDSSSNSAVFTQTIIIEADVLPPVVSWFPVGDSVACEIAPAAYQSWLATQVANFAASDPSGIKSLTNNAPPNFPSGCSVPVPVTFKATDNCNLMYPVHVVFKTADTKAPDIIKSPRDTVAYCTSNGSPAAKLSEWISKRANSETLDACSQPQNYRMQVNGVNRDSAQIMAAFADSMSVGTGCGAKIIGGITYNKVRASIKVDFYAKDACNNETWVGDALFAAVDTVKPVLAGTDFLEQCGPTNSNDQSNLQAWINAHGFASVTDECSATSWTNFSYTSSDGQSNTGLFGIGPFPQVKAHQCNWFVDVTFRATDECGNTGQKTLRFQIQDTQKPVISGYPDTITVLCTNPNPVLPKQYIADNCDTSMVVSYTAIQGDSLCDGSYTMTVTWSAADDCGNVGTAIQTVLVRDTEAPVFTLIPASKTFYCDTFVLPAAPVMGLNIMATDNCSPVLSITTQDASTQNPSPAQCGHYNYTITRLFTATDECGNTRTATQVLSIIDPVPPVPQGIFDTTANCEILPAIPLPPPTATDACSGPTAAPLLLSQSITPGTCTDRYTVTLNWVASDVCGNSTTFTQVVHVQDTVAPQLVNIPPDISVDCKGIPSPPALNSLNPSDNCDSNPLIVLQETEIRNPDTTNCDHWSDYILRREWTVTDNCGNTRRYTQNIQIEDNNPPVLTPPNPLIRPNTLDSCGAFVAIPAPLSVYDICTSSNYTFSQKDTALLVNTMNNPNNVVDTVKLQWVAPNVSPGQPVIGNASLNLNFQNADINSASEIFQVLGENGAPLTNTVPAGGTMCTTSVNIITITAAQANEWLSDGVINITLVPNIVGDAVNAICPGARIIGTLSYSYYKPYVPVNLSFSIDGGVQQPYPPSGTYYLEKGLHTLTYTASDCSGNTASASSVIDVRDQQAPQISPIATQTAYVSTETGCLAAFVLPFPKVYENCIISSATNFNSASLPVIFSNDNLPEDITLNISGLIPTAVQDGKLIIRHLGDNHDNGEFFTIYDENQAPLDSTEYGSLAEECFSYNETVIPVSAAQINAWAANGNTFFKLVANKNISYPDLIQPCPQHAIQPDMTDSISRVEARLMYAPTSITYEIRKGINGPFAVPTGALNGSQTTVSLPPGLYTVKYSITDMDGLTGSTTYTLVVRDTVKPQAKCKPSFTLNINPVGTSLSAVTLSPLSVNNGSTDNCSAVTLSVSPNAFNCTDAASPNNPFLVTLTVKDTSNNVSTCTSLVEIETLPPSVSSTVNVCEGETLQLFSNTPGGGTNTTFDYFWSFNNGPVFSNAQNPVVNNAATAANAGVYTLVIRGLTGCTSSASVTVNVGNFPAPSITTSGGVTRCLGQNITLSSTPPPGGGIPNLQYYWYADSLPTDILLGQSTLPNFTLTAPPVGSYRYYVRYASNNCFSLASNVITINVNPVPTANPSPTSILVCEGQPISLNVSSVQAQTTYTWSGPNFPANNNPSPLVTTSADSVLHDGNYSLVVTRLGCSSPPAIVPVEVKTKPKTPQITGDGTVCTGDNVVMTYNLPPGESVSQYEWQRPNGTTFVVNGINAYTIVNTTLDSAGSWRLRVYRQGCPSEWSAPFLVSPQEYPDVTASVNSPVCLGDTIFLNANSNIALPGIGGWFWSGVNTPYVQYTQNAFMIPVSDGVYTFKVVGRRENGCQDSAFVTTTVVKTPSIIAVQNTAPVCWDGVTSASLSATINAPNPILNYCWDRNGTPYSTAPTPLIVGNQSIETFNGTYSLLVKDIYGCVSNVMSTTVNANPPLATPSLGVAAPVCEGVPVTLSIDPGGNYPTGAQFTWIRPNGTDTVTTTQFLNLPTPTVSGMSGQYRVFVTTSTSNCKSDTSTARQVTIYARPATPVASSNSPVCDGAVIQFNIENIPLPPNVTYTWGGVAGFTASIPNPTRNAIPAHAGKYWVKATSEFGNCVSDQDTVQVVVNPLPNTPFVVPATEFNTPQRLCFVEPGAATSLNITPMSQTLGAAYTWIRIPGNQMVAGPLSTSNVTLDSLAPGLHRFRVQAHKAGCLSPLSDTVFIQVDVIPPSTAEAGADKTACIDAGMTNISLDGIMPSTGTGLWSQIGGPAISFINASIANTAVSGAKDGDVLTLVWTLSNGACMNYDADTVNITARMREDAQAPMDTFVCDLNNIQLNAKASKHGGFWTQSPGNLLPDNVFSSPFTPNTTVSFLRAGNPFTFYWNIENYGCGNPVDEVIVRVYSGKPNAGPDENACAQDSCWSIMASALQPTFEKGQWFSLTNDPNIHFTNEFSEKTTVCGLKVGPNPLLWIINDGVCGNNSRDTVVINYQLLPKASDDMVSVPFGGEVSINVLSNDNVPDLFKIFLLTQPSFGGISDSSLLNAGLLNYRPSSSFSGEDFFTYRLVNQKCPANLASTGKVTITVLPAGECQINNVVTPNGDQANDYFVIPQECAVAGEGTIEIELSIYNQWGHEVFHSKDYQNDWDGTLNGNPLPEGTYYYVIKEGGVITKKNATGFIMLVR